MNEAIATLGNNVPMAQTITADEMYERLRGGIRGAFTMLVENNRPLVFATDLIWSYDNFLDAIQKLGGERQHYECQQCRSFWNRYSRAYGVNQDGALTHPFGMVIASLHDDHGPLIDGVEYKPVRHLEGSLIPVHRLRDSFSTSEAGGFQHFHGCDEATSRKWNGEREEFADMKVIEAIISRMSGQNKFYNAGVIRMLHDELVKKIRIKESIGLLVPYAGLLEAISTIKPKSLTAFLRIFLTEKRNHWLLGVEGSTAGIVLSHLRELTTQFNEAYVDRVVGIIQAATDASVYKKRTAPTTLSAVERATCMLTNSGWERFVERKVVNVNDIATLWNIKDAPEFVATKAEGEQPDNRSALQKAADGFRPNGGNTTAPSDEVASVLQGIRSKERDIVDISLQAFKSVLADNKTIGGLRLRMPVMTGHYIVLATDAVDDADYSGLMENKAQAVASRPFSSYVVSTERLNNGGAINTIRTVAREQDKEPTSLIEDRGLMKINIRAVGTYTVDRQGAEETVVAFFDDVCFLRDVFRHSGSIILGTMIKQEHYGHSRAICQLGDRIPLQAADGPEAGGFAIGVGSAVEVLFEDGSVSVYRIASKS